MAEEEVKAEAGAIVEAGPVSSWLTEQGFAHEIMERDHLALLYSTLCIRL